MTFSFGKAKNAPDAEQPGTVPPGTVPPRAAEPAADPAPQPAAVPARAQEPAPAPDTAPAPRPADPAAADSPPADSPPADPGTAAAAPALEPVRRTRVGALWMSVILAAVVLVLLLVFIVQNSARVDISFLGAHGHLPLGVALLLAAVSGILLVAIPGTGRIIQLRRQVRRGRRAYAEDRSPTRTP